MRRKARPIPFKRRPAVLARGLMVQGQSKWPEHFQKAWKILHEELRVSKDDADAILFSSITAAHACAEAIDRRIRKTVEFRNRKGLCKAFKRIANCAKRAPADLRHSLDRAIIPFVKQQDIDLESFESIFDAVVKVFEAHSHQEAARTALAVLTYRPPGGEQYRTLENSFSGLGVDDQRECEKEILLLARTSIEGITASDIFAALATAIERRHSAPEGSQIHDLIVDYLARVAEIWRRFELRRPRAGHAKRVNYRKKLRVFSDLVVTEIVEPTSRRHTGDREKMLDDIRQAHKKFPAEWRSAVSPALRRADTEWLVSTDHIAKALRR